MGSDSVDMISSRTWVHVLHDHTCPNSLASIDVGALVSMHASRGLFGIQVEKEACALAGVYSALKTFVASEPAYKTFQTCYNTNFCLASRSGESEGVRRSTQTLSLPSFVCGHTVDGV